MTEKKAFDQPLEQEKKPIWGKYLGGAVVLLALVAFGCSGGGEKSPAGTTEQKSVAPETVVQTTAAPTKDAPPPPAAIKPEAKVAPRAQQPPEAPKPPPSLGMTPEEFRLRFNKTSEFVKSKLRIKKLNIEAGSGKDSFKHVFNENLYLTGEVNKAEGTLAQVNFTGVLNGSLATTVDLNVCFGTIITAFSPKLSPDERDSVIYALGITNKDVDIYTLDKKITKNGITYWVKSSRKAGIHFGARSAQG